MLKIFKSPIVSLAILGIIAYTAYKLLQKPDALKEGAEEGGGIAGGIPKLKYPAKEKGFFEFTPYQWFGYDIRNIFSK